jgi:hypothetical protein
VRRENAERPSVRVVLDRLRAIAETLGAPEEETVPSGA